MIVGGGGEAVAGVFSENYCQEHCPILYKLAMIVEAEAVRVDTKGNLGSKLGQLLGCNRNCGYNNWYYPYLKRDMVFQYHMNNELEDDLLLIDHDRDHDHDHHW